MIKIEKVIFLIVLKKVEEVVGLEPTHVGFAIRGITSFAIPPTEMYSLFLNHLKLKKVR